MPRLLTDTPAGGRGQRFLVLASQFAFLSLFAVGHLGGQEVTERAGQGEIGHHLVSATVTTKDGRSVTGVLRWNRRGGSWGDVLQASRSLDPLHQEEAVELGIISPLQLQRSVEYRGVRVTWNEELEPVTAELRVRIGHIRALVPVDGGARLELKAGGVVTVERVLVELESGGRGLRIETDEGGTEVPWDEVERVEFGDLSEREAVIGKARRLHGTVTDEGGRRFTGAISWDRDESFSDDVLDGDELTGNEREIEFDSISAIHKIDRKSASITLLNGDTAVLTGSNDVDDSNRGIEVIDHRLGVVTVPWTAFRSIELDAVFPSTRYEEYDGGSRLQGTVIAEDGSEVTGRIRWDNDERWSWEMLDGTDEAGLEYAIEFSEIEQIRKVSPAGAAVLLRDGRRFELSGSNDVDQANKGIFVTSEDGSRVAFSWSNFHEVRFTR